MKTTMEELAPLRGWRNYFGFCETPEVLVPLIALLYSDFVNDILQVRKSWRGRHPYQFLKSDFLAHGDRPPPPLSPVTHLPPPACSTRTQCHTPVHRCGDGEVSHKLAEVDR